MRQGRCAMFVMCRNLLRNHHRCSRLHEPCGQGSGSFRLLRLFRVTVNAASDSSEKRDDKQLGAREVCDILIVYINIYYTKYFCLIYIFDLHNTHNDILSEGREVDCFILFMTFCSFDTICIRYCRTCAVCIWWSDVMSSICMIMNGHPLAVMVNLKYFQPPCAYIFIAFAWLWIDVSYASEYEPLPHTCSNSLWAQVLVSWDGSTESTLQLDSEARGRNATLFRIIRLLRILRVLRIIRHLASEATGCWC